MPMIIRHMNVPEVANALMMAEAFSIMMDMLAHLGG